jgi:c-di-GMP-binding flagellar brake protein YcgR
MEHTERREYFRVKDRLPIEYRVIDEKEYSRLENVIKYNPTRIIDKVNEMYFLRKIVTKDEKEKDQIYGYLQILDKKLDIILELLRKSREDELYTSAYCEVNMSGAGIQFLSGAPLLAKGALVELRIILPIFPYPKISSLCRVVRENDHTVEEAAQPGVALEFMTINEEDRDLLISYVFTKEREYLRLIKEQAG